MCHPAGVDVHTMSAYVGCTHRASRAGLRSKQHAMHIIGNLYVSVHSYSLSTMTYANDGFVENGRSFGYVSDNCDNR